MKTLENFDISYRKSIQRTFTELQNVSEDISRDYKFDLNKTEVTEAILERLKCYYQTQGLIKEFLNKRYLTAGADYFVETILFFLRLYLKFEAKGLEAHSERQIQRTKNAIRPDISIWNQDNVVAIIECKTQLGWKRKEWEDQFNERNAILRSLFPQAQSFLLVMTSSNWGGFGQSERLNQQYFCLLGDKVLPRDYNCVGQILTPIEGLLKQL